MTSPVFIGDTGTEIVLDTEQTITGATVMKVVARKPNGVAVQWPAVADSSTAIKYLTQPNDLDVAGEWQLQAYVELPAWKGSGAVASMTVAQVL